MAMVVKDFDRYTVQLHGGVNTSGGDVQADINCYKGGTLVGLIRFFSDAVAIPKNQSLGDQVQLYYGFSHFHEVIGLIRYEKPLYLAINTDTKFGYIGTGTAEPIGEQEGV